jgi:hypothetical protein
VVYRTFPFGLEPEMESSKPCSSCEQQKPLSEFYSKGNRTDSVCKNCRRVERRTRYSKSTGETSNTTTNNSVSTSGKSSDELAESSSVDGANLLLPEQIRQVAELFLLLEGWQADLDTQQDLSNSKSIQKQMQK